MRVFHQNETELPSLLSPTQGRMEARRAALIFMKNSQFDRTLRYGSMLEPNLWIYLAKWEQFYLAYYQKVHQNFSLFFRHIITSKLQIRVYLLSCNVLEIHSVSGWCVIVVCFEKWYDMRIAVGWAVMMTRDPQYWRWQITNAWKSNCRTYSINTINTVSAALAIISVVIKFRLMPQFTYLTYDTQIKFEIRDSLWPSAY